MKNYHIIANWKMQLNTKESIELFSKIQDGVSDKNQSEIVVCPSFTAISEVSKIRKEDKKIKLGGQDVFWEEVGAYTGEISCKMLKETGVSYVIIGHSDRRKYFNETDEIVHYKVKASLGSSLFPIICVGENFQERKEGRKEYVIINQITKALSGIEIKGDELIIIAYEPVWVIGSGQAIDAQEAESIHQIIKKSLVDLFSMDVMKKNFKIIYGGSINKNVVGEFLIQPTIDGVLVGGASLNPDEFIGIINKANKILC